MGRSSPLVRYYAVRLILDEIAFALAGAFLLVVSIIWSLSSVLRSGFDLSTVDWRFLLLKGIAFWLILQLLALGNAASSVWAAVQAARGHVPARRSGVQARAGRLAGMVADGELKKISP